MTSWWPSHHQPDDTNRSYISMCDLVAEAFAAIARRPGRSMLTALGTVVGVGAFVATTGLASTARAQVSERFDRLKATEVRVLDADEGDGDPFPEDVDERLERLNGVNHAGKYWTVSTPGIDARVRPDRLDQRSQVPVVAATPGAIAATQPVLQTGRLFDEFHNRRGERVALIGAALARQWGMTRVDNQPAVFLGDTGYTVIGIIDDVGRNPDLLLSVVVPASTATTRLSTPESLSATTFEVLIDVDPGAAQLIGSQAAIALRPDQPEQLQVLIPPDPRQLRADVEGDVTGLFYGLAGLALLVGIIGIANTTLVAVLERRSEIGVRRALGARRRHIAAQFLTESATLGALGGIVGASAGILVVVTISAARQWTTTIEPVFPLLAPAIGAITGLIAGLQPAIRAANIQPADVLRG